MNIWSQWSFDPLILLGIGLTSFLYLRGWRTLARRGTPPPAWKKWSFLAGLLIILLALISPLDALAEQLFSAHMVQHTLLMMFGPPLLVLGLPLPTLLLGLPRKAQVVIGRSFKSAPAFWNVLRFFLNPVIVWLLHAAALWGWHAPPLYTASLENEWIHIAQHISFTGTALLFWWVALHSFATTPERRGAGFLYIFTTAMQSGFLGALITFSPSAWYSIYDGLSEAWGLSVLADQQLAGTIMWVPAGLVYLAAALAMLKPWFDNLPSAEGSVPQKEID